jgi:hypothetical protein
MNAEILADVTGLAGATKATVEAIREFSAKAKGNLSPFRQLPLR